MKKININPTDFCACILATEMPEACFFGEKKPPTNSIWGQKYIFTFTPYMHFFCTSVQGMREEYLYCLTS